MITRIIVIGGGPGGYVAALEAANLGGDVTLVEQSELGGTCLNKGCIPSKIMKHSADIFMNVKTSDQFGIKINGEINFDLMDLMAKKNSILASQRKAVAGLLKNRKIKIEKGRAFIKSSNLIRIETEEGVQKELEFDKLILATGTQPSSIANVCFDHNRILSSDDILDMKSVPESIVIIGAGVIGCEFAFILSAFGAQVTLVEGMSRLLPFPQVDHEISKNLLREMKKNKIKILFDTIVTDINEDKDGLIIELDRSTFTDNKKPKSLKVKKLQANKVGICTGRSPLTGDLGLENAGVAVSDKGWIEVDFHCQTKVKDIYAVGDILGPDKIMLAHVAYHEGIIAARNAMGMKSQMNYSAVPLTIFTMPEIACVGLAQSQARKMGFDVECVSVNFRNLGKAHAIGELAGMGMLVMNKEDKTILGVHLIGAHATDLIGEGVVAVEKGMTIKDFEHTIHAHPTLSEIMGELFLKANNSPVHG